MLVICSAVRRRRRTKREQKCGITTENHPTTELFYPKVTSSNCSPVPPVHSLFRFSGLLLLKHIPSLRSGLFYIADHTLVLPNISRDHCGCSDQDFPRHPTRASLHTSVRTSDRGRSFVKTCQDSYHRYYCSIALRFQACVHGCR